ncbi:MAG TPA: hypothetical protein VGZ29_11530, partial [Terriglobia bacterium]|nr:hypothetical protein [Terriglobia bacterium]
LDGRNYAVIELKVTTERASSAPPARNRPLGLPGSRIALLAEMGALLLMLTVMLNRVRARSFAGLRPRIMASLGTLLLLLTIAWIACGGGPAFVFTPPSGGTPAGSYVVTVTATSGHLSHAITVGLTVR